jgi:hypothetical protein
VPPRVSPALPRVQAALALVIVDNQTSSSLTVSFRAAARPRGVVSIGEVPAGATRQLAPIPATEPIILTATNPAGGTLELGTRTFAIDEEWRWVIRADARFHS